MELDQEKLDLLDRVCLDYLSKADNLADRWLFEQTIYTAPVRRTIFQYFPFEAYASVLDAGTGFGVLAIELAGQMPVTVHGVDVDPSKLHVARQLANQLQGTGYFHPNSEIQFYNDDLYAPSFRENQFDFAISRFVYQHLEKPDKVTEQLYRAVRPGGYVCLIDIDDQFSVSYPETTGSLQKLEQLFAELQERKGGDRYVGRKISTYLHNSGFEIRGVAIQPQANHAVVQRSDASNEFLLSRLQTVKRELLEHEILSENEFGSYISEIEQMDEITQFNATAQVVVIAQKPNR